jgi:ATP-dependent Clp protease ATP-binding subunit ClpA
MLCHRYIRKIIRLITEKNIQNTLTKKTGVPVGDIGSEEKQRLLNLENILHQRVIGQEDAILEISNAMRRARAGVKTSQKPIGSFLFLGPTGVGKTETAKALAEAYFGSEDKIIRFDMSEFQNINSLNRFLGAPAGTPNAEAGGEITNAIKDNPFSLILFDEIEKAHPNILNLFLQVLDEGWLTDSLGRKVKFSNAIIIATSNAGAEYIRQKIKEGIDITKLKNELIEYLQQEKLFRPEFINRFTGVISFKPLTKDEVLKITELMLKSLKKNILKEKDINISIEAEAMTYLAELGFDPVLGARPIKRTIQDKIENLIAKKILNNEISKGSTLNISLQDIKE